MGGGSRINDENTAGEEEEEEEEEEGDFSSATPSSSSPSAAGATANDENTAGKEEEEEEEEEEEKEEGGEGDPSSATPYPSSPPAAGASASVSRTMTTVSRHYFGGDSSADHHDLSIEIIENMQEDYGMFVWPCARVLSEYVWQQRSRFLSVSVLELGAGTSLPGLVAAKVGANVTLTDNSCETELYFRPNKVNICNLGDPCCREYNIFFCKDVNRILGLSTIPALVLDNMKRICDMNGLKCEILGLTWGEWDEPLMNLHPQIVLGADVLYDTTEFDDLFATVAYLLQYSPGSVFITTYHSRSGHHLIEFLLVKWGLRCSKLLDAYSFMPPNKACWLKGNIQIVEITIDSQFS